MRAAVPAGGRVRSGLLALLLLLPPACTPAPAAPLRVGLNTWAGYEGLNIAVSRGLVPAGSVRLVQFPSASEELRALAAGDLDAAALTADEALRAAAMDSAHPPRVVHVLDISAGADQIVARPPIRSVRDLRGKRVGAESTALGAYMLARALELNGLRPEEIRLVRLPIFDQERAYRAGEVDALVTFEPAASRLAALGARAIFDTRDIPGEVVDVLVVRDTVRSRVGPALRDLIRGWYAAERWIASDTAAAYADIATHEGITMAVVSRARSQMRIPDLAANRRLLAPGEDGLAPTLRRLVAVLRQYDLTAPASDPAALLDPSFQPDSVR